MLDQAAAFIEKTRCGFSTYHTLYETQRKTVLNERGSLTTDHPESVTIPFSLVFQRVKSASAAAEEFLLCCSFLSPDVISEGIIMYGGALLAMIVRDLAACNTAIGILLAYSLMQRNTDSTTGAQVLSMHRLVQAVLQDGMEKAEKK